MSNLTADKWTPTRNGGYWTLADTKLSIIQLPDEDEYEMGIQPNLQPWRTAAADTYNECTQVLESIAARLNAGEALADIPEYKLFG